MAARLGLLELGQQLSLDVTEPAEEGLLPALGRQRGQQYADSIRQALTLTRQAQTSTLRSAAQPGRMPEEHTGQPGVDGGAARGGDSPDLMDVREACADAGYDFAGN